MTSSSLPKMILTFQMESSLKGKNLLKGMQSLSPDPPFREEAKLKMTRVSSPVSM